VNLPDKTGKDFDRLWKIRSFVDILGDIYAKFYNPSEHLAVGKVTVLFKGRVIFKQYVPKKHIHFGIKMYKLCDMTGYTYNMSTYLGKDVKMQPR
jgi:hypothetical protein